MFENVMTRVQALPRGYDHGCRLDDGGERPAASACMLQEHFRRNCPNATLDHVRQFLDDPRLIAWYIHHDAILFRSSPADPLTAHPKLVSLPLGTSIRLDEFWADQAVSALEQQVHRVRPITIKDNGMGMRKIVTDQLASRFATVANESRARANEFEYMRTVRMTRPAHHEPRPRSVTGARPTPMRPQYCC